MAMSARCSRCLVWKPRTEFHRDAAHPNGLQSWCKTCRAENSRTSPAARAQRRRAWEQIKADPDRHAAWLEKRRIEWRLRAEQRGHVVIPRSVKDTRTGARKRVTYDDPRLPPEPFVTLLQTLGDNAEQIADTLDDEGFARSVRRYLSGGSAHVKRSIVERVCLRVGVDPADLYPDVYADAGDA